MHFPEHNYIFSGIINVNGSQEPYRLNDPDLIKKLEYYDPEI